MSRTAKRSRRKSPSPDPRQPRARPEPTLAHAPTTAREERVFDAALKLISEQGVAGTSLRALARELGMSQPSLYHYFESKDQLIAKIVPYCASKMLGAAPFDEMPSDVMDLPRFVIAGVLELWRGKRHPRFTRFLFAVAIEKPAQRRHIEQVFRQQLYGSMPQMVQLYSKERNEQEEIGQIIRSIVGALGLALLEERALFGNPRPSPLSETYAEWLIEAARTLLRTRVLDKRGRRRPNDPNRRG